MRIFLLLAALLSLGCAPPRFAKQRLGTLSSAPVALDIDASAAMALDPQRLELTREYFRIHAPALELRAPFQMQPKVVVVHYTAIPTLEATFRVFRAETIDPGRTLVAAYGRLNVGIQFVVDRDGKVYRLFPETTMVRHVIGLNHVAIGIENVGSQDLSADQMQGRAPTGGNGLQLTPAQLEANVALIRLLKQRHPGIEWVIGHHEYRDFEHPRHPGHGLFVEAIPQYRTEKSDPGPFFMQQLRKRLKEPGP
jgi:N-acetyl-anhydromuramyl-L-alanine amidase AmpD